MILRPGAACAAALAFSASSPPAAYAARNDDGPRLELAAATKKIPGEARKSDAPAAGDQMTLDQFLDRLMMAESGGRATAKNPRSTALGPFQFIASTWLQVARRALAKEIENLSPADVLALRTDPELARRAAAAYTADNAAYLAAQGHAATFRNLRLAFLVGAGGAARILAAKPDEPVAELLGATVIGANPFMLKMTAADLIARSARDIGSDVSATAGLTPDEAAVGRAKIEAAAVAAAPRARPAFTIRCDAKLASCRRWIALQTRKAARSKSADRATKPAAVRR